MFVLLFFLAFFPVSTIQVDIGDQSYLLKDERFIISWIHSVEKEEWKEAYIVQEDSFLLSETAFKTFGAGSPYNEGNTYIQDGFVVMEIGETIPEINMMISKNVQTTLIIEDKPIFLYQLIDEEYENAHFYHQKIPLWKFLKGESL